MTLVYDGADPRLMSDADLKAEHDYIHRLLEGDCDPEDLQYIRFDSLGEHGRSLLTLRHEFIRVGLVVRHGTRLEGRDAHWSPVDHSDLLRRHAAGLLLFERHALPLRIHREDRDGEEIVTYNRPSFADGARYYMALAARMGFPPPSCTPWGERSMSLKAYVLANRQLKGST